MKIYLCVLLLSPILSLTQSSAWSDEGISLLVLKSIPELKRKTVPSKDKPHGTLIWKKGKSNSEAICLELHTALLRRAIGNILQREAKRLSEDDPQVLALEKQLKNLLKHARKRGKKNNLYRVGVYHWIEGDRAGIMTTLRPNSKDEQEVIVENRICSLKNIRSWMSSISVQEFPVRTHK